MLNEGILLTTAILDLAFVLFLFRFGKEGVTASIVANIILVSTFGTKLILIFGFPTNAGNIYYASTLLASNMLTEHYGKRISFRAVWIGFSALVLFIIMGQFAIRFVGLPESMAANEAIHTLFSGVPRIAFASMAAYLVIQNLNVWLFDALRSRTGRALLWLRNIVSQTCAQFIDSILFFGIAFFGVLPLTSLFEAIAIGFAVKSVVGILSTPFLYGSYFVKTPGTKAPTHNPQ